MATVFHCKYLKATLFRISQKYHAQEKQKKYNEFSSQFAHITMDYQKFITYYNRFVLNTNKKKLQKGVREAWIDMFSLEKWNALDDGHKRLHTVRECQPCKFIIFDPSPRLPVPSISLDSTCSTPSQSFHSSPSTPHPTPSSNLQMPKTPTTPFSSLKIDIPIHSTPSVKHQKQAASTVLTKLNEEFHCLYGKKFTDVVCKVPEAKLQAKPTEAERKKRDRKIRRDVRDELQNVLYSRDSQVLFGTRQTASQYESQRKAMFMESPADAKARTEKRNLVFISVNLVFF